MKTCRVCKNDFPEDNFYWIDKKNNRRRADCKQCSLNTNKEYASKNREAILEYSKNWKKNNAEKVKAANKHHSKKLLANNKAKLLAYLKHHCCNRCGFTDHRTFQFHHVDPITKKNSINRLMTSSWPIIEAEITKCEILCANCHQIETIESSNSYRNK